VHKTYFLAFCFIIQNNPSLSGELRVFEKGSKGNKIGLRSVKKAE
jgi:hypothetical protein